MTPIHILLIDDEDNFLEALSKRLTHRGYTVDCASSGVAGLRLLEEIEGIDVVLLDVRMPGLDGLETLQRIKKKRPLVETIMLTAHATVAAAVEALRVGAWDYLMKPCDLDELALKVDAAAGRKRDRERKIADVQTRPYITNREKKELIAAILAS
jgi:DNA-binding NtrC family response regulator